jgi:hypothetical protein
MLERSGEEHLGLGEQTGEQRAPRRAQTSVALGM